MFPGDTLDAIWPPVGVVVLGRVWFWVADRHDGLVMVSNRVCYPIVFFF